MGCSYYSYSNSYFDTAIHTDICSPIATDPIWGDLGQAQQNILLNAGLQIWNELVKDLKPDIMLVSIKQNLFINYIAQHFGNPIYTVTHNSDGTLRDIPTHIYSQQKILNGKSTKIIFANSANKPFDKITNIDKLKIGRVII